MTSGLKVNFFKSCFIGVNVGRDFKEGACDFLNCLRELSLLIIWGYLWGANPRKLST